MKVTVVGAGVIGLTSAIRLREAGYETDIVAADDVQAVAGLPPVQAEYFVAGLTDSDGAQSFLAYLQSDRARSILGGLGFTP